VSAERLQKVLADAGVASRRASEALIAAGRVTVDGRVAAIGEKVDPASAAIAVDGRPLASRTSAHLYLALNKPAGVVSTTADRHAERTVLDLVPRELLRSAGRLYPVGRLDRDSEGLILLTNDGEWTDRVLHPSHRVEREYAAGLPRPLQPDEIRRLEAGIRLEEGIATLAHLRPMTGTEVGALAAVLAPPRIPLAWYRVTLEQGWKRQVRRMFGAVGVPVARLVRVRVGTLRLGTLAPGAVRPLSGREAEALARVSSRR
jgi:23S rRNA pseudouridine2605 synthase